MDHSAVNAPAAAGHLAGSAPNRVAFQTAEGFEAAGPWQHLSRHAVTFEIFQSDITLRASEVINGFKVLAAGRTIYFGRAVVSGMVQAGGSLMVQAKLTPAENETPLLLPDGRLAPDAERAYADFFQAWRQEYRIAPEFKVLVADIAAYLTGVRQWLEQLEFSFKEKRDRQTPDAEAELLGELARRIIPAFNIQHERFEELADQVPPELLGAHQEFVRRHWQRLFLGSPFGHRTFHKPLGFAGDYEMMDMIHRHQPEGNSLYEKLIHLLLLDQWPAKSVRNRIAHLKGHLVAETARVARRGRRARILNIGCGPARELQDFLRETNLSNEVDCTLVDFNRETLDFAGLRLESERQRAARRARFSMVNLSVNQLLRRAVKQGDMGLGGGFDLIYCGGLFDYLSAHTCTEMTGLFHENLQPDGLMVLANMNDARPFRKFIEFVLDWHLIYRGADAVRLFAPERLRARAAVVSEETAVNLFLHLRRLD